MTLILLGGIANLVFLVGFWFRDILLLRVFALFGFCFLIPYLYFQTEPLWIPIGWTVAFIGVHTYRVWTIFEDRNPEKLTREDNSLYLSGFELLTPRQFKNVIEIGQWRDLTPGQQIQTNGGPAIMQFAILHGAIEARADHRKLGMLGPGDFVGIGCIEENAHDFCDMTVIRPTRVLCWNHRELMHLLASDQQLLHVLRKIAGASLAPLLLSIVES